MRLALAVLLFLASSLAAAEDQPAAQSSQQSSVKLGARLDCVQNFNANKGSKQACVNISGLRLDYSRNISNELFARIRLNPFGTTSANYENTPWREDIPRINDTKFVLIDNYAFMWTPRPSLEIAIEQYSGAARIPSMSGLANGLVLSDMGWYQTAVTTTYRLHALNGMLVKFAAGNGEGENGGNMDPQQFFGLELESTPIEGLVLNAGFSFDGNNVGSAEYQWQTRQYRKMGFQVPEGASVGYSTQRLSFGVALDGKMPVLRGLKLGFGWQRATLNGLSKDGNSAPDANGLMDNCKNSDGTAGACKPIDVGTLFVEDPNKEKVNFVQRQLWALNGSYRILDRYFIGFDYEMRDINLGEVKFFETCNAWNGLQCDDPNKGAPTSTISQSSYAVGGGLDLTENLSLTMEYNAVQFTKLYKQAFYVTRNDHVAKERDGLVARIAYNW